MKMVAGLTRDIKREAMKRSFDLAADIVAAIPLSVDAECQTVFTVKSGHNTSITKGYATRNDIVEDFVTMLALDAIFATLKSIVDNEIVDDIVTCGRALSVRHLPRPPS